MVNVLIVIQIVLAVSVVVVVLLQKSSSIGLGAYSGSNESIFGAKGPASFMSKVTVVLGLAFIINTLILSYTYNNMANKSLVDKLDIPDNPLPISVPFNSLNPTGTSPLNTTNPLGTGLNPLNASPLGGAKGTPAQATESKDADSKADSKSDASPAKANDEEADR